MANVSQTGYEMGTDMRRMRFQAYLLVMVASVAVAAVLGGPREARADGPDIVRGDLIVEFGQWCGEGCEGEFTDLVAVFSNPSASLKGAVSLGDTALGPMITANNGDIYALAGATIMLIPADGSAVSEFELQLQPGESFLPTGIAFDSLDRLYVSGQLSYQDEESSSLLGEGVFRASGSPQFFEQLSSGAVPEGEQPYGVGIAGCTVTYWSYQTIRRWDWCEEEQLSDFDVGFALHSDAIVLGDGSLLAAEDDEIHRYYPDGLDRTFGGDEVCATSADAFEGRIYYTIPCNRQIRYIDMVSGETGVFREFTEEELTESYGDGRPIRVRVARGSGAERPRSPVIFAHGFQQPVVADPEDSQSFWAIEDELAARSIPMERFRFFQDKACGSANPGRPEVGSGSIWTEAVEDFSSTFDAFCDSQSDMGINAVLLAQAALQASERADGVGAILIGYSMGGGIIRGVLDQQADDPRLQGSVRASIFLNAVHDGSLIANTGDAIAKIPDWVRIESKIEDAIEEFSNGVDPNRPAVDQFSGNSSWYQWANDDSRPLPDIDYFSFFGDLVLRQQACGFPSRYKFIPTSAPKCWDVSWSVGDLVLFAGTDDPYDHPGTGGARFKPDNGRSRQWEISGELRLARWKTAWPGNWDDEAARISDALANFPAMHVRIPKHADQAFVPRCDGPGTVSVAEQVALIVQSLRGEGSYSCSP